MKPSRYLGTRLVAIAVVVMLPLLAIVGYGLYEGVRAAEGRAREALPVQASLAAAQVNAALDRSARVLEFAAARMVGRPVDDSTCQRELGGLDDVDALMGNLGVIGFDGRVLCVLVPAPGGRIPSIEVDEEFQRAAASESIWISQPFRSQISGAPALMMTSPLRDADGRRVGLVGARLDLSKLDALLASLQRPPGGALAVVDPTGAVVRRAGPGRPEAQALHSSEGVAEPSALQASADVGRFGWRVVASVQRDVLLAPVRDRVMLAAASVWVATLLGVLAALRAAQHVARPLQDLLATTRAQRGGHTQARANEGAPGEFGLLAAEFNRMVEQLRQTEANLGESERRYADLFGNIQVAAAMVDLEGRFVYVNDHLLAVTGWQRDELLGQDMLATLQPHRRAQREQVITQLQAGHLAGHNETDVVTRSGERRRMKAFRATLRSPEGDVVGLAIMAEDITERRAAERKATRLSAFYAALSRTGEALVRMQDEPSLYDALCRICVETGQADRADLIGTEGDQAWLAAQFARATLFDQTQYPTRFTLSERPWLLTSQAIRSGEPLICADYASDPRTAEARQQGYGIGYRSLAVLPLRRGGQVSGALVLFSAAAALFDDDIVQLLLRMTAEVSFALDRFDLERSRERALSETQAGLERFSRVFRGAPAGIIIAELADGTIVDLNEAACRNYGISREQAVGRTLASLGRGASPELRQSMVERLLREGRIDNTEMTVTGADGKLQTMLGSAELIDWEGQSRMMTMGVNITSLRAAAQAREDMRAAERANAAKTEFISRMSHELRTPLNAVLGFAQLLEDPGAPLTPRQRTYLRQLHDGASHLRALIDDVIDVASIEAGRLKAEPRPVDLGAAVASAITLCAAAAAQARVELVADRGPAGGVQAMADPTRLRQVLANLVSNGIKYNRPGGKVRVAAGTADGWAHVDVIDDGLGMTPAQLQRLFTPYDRLGRQGSGVAGTGIGLVLSKQLVQIMGGRLSVHSEPGRGTRMRVELPLAAVAPPADAPTDAAPAASLDAIGLVLYVEDEPVNRLLVQEALRPCTGVELLLAEDGRSGMNCARERVPDLVLLDMHLPDMDGREVMSALRGDPSTCQIAVVALSASAMPEEVDLAHAGGALEYWSKPIDVERLRSDVCRLVAAARRPH